MIAPIGILRSRNDSARNCASWAGAASSVDTTTNAVRGSTSSASTSLARLTNDELAFVDIFSDAYRYIKVYDFSKKTSRIITKIPADVTSFAVRDKDSYFITQGNKILRYVAGTDVSWKTFYSFEAYGMNKLTEIYSIKHNHFIIKNEN